MPSDTTDTASFTSPSLHPTLYGLKAESEFNWIERLALKCFHPRALFIEIAGFVWAFYYFWNYNWQVALIILIASMAMGVISVAYTSSAQLAHTVLGRIALLHLHPMNFGLRLVGDILILYGVWTRSLELGLFGLSVILIGHAFGWSRVEAEFARQV